MSAPGEGARYVVTDTATGAGRWMPPMVPGPDLAPMSPAAESWATDPGADEMPVRLEAAVRALVDAVTSGEWDDLESLAGDVSRVAGWSA